MIENDIELKNNGNGTFDWKFLLDDVSDVRGNARLRSNVIHAILLRPYELEQEFYAFEGCVAWDYINDKRVDHVLTLLAEGMRLSAQKIDGVKDATVELNTRGGYNVVSSILLFKDDGTEVLIEWNSEQNLE